ncbi:hypothetical protein [Neolewinella xylanilytica]|uniref:hypothetical protein n=1 Tax=Neolewinella xylanilytica TaxID=1514080 RepID=UPI0011B0BE05|nr:hypothetical protein [Neolewinella xylanilytica]
MKHENINEKSEAKWLKYIRYTFAIVFGSVILGMSIYQSWKIGDFKELMLSDAFNNEIIDTYSARSYNYVLLSGFDRRVQIRDSRSLTHGSSEAYWLRKFLEPGNTLIKKPCSDTLTIITGDRVHKFLAEDILADSSLHTIRKIAEFRARRRIVTDNNDCY